MAVTPIERRMRMMRNVASVLYPRPVPMLDTLNGHARLKRWLSHESAPVFEHRFGLYDYVKATCLSSEPINYLEFGVHQGESFRRWLQIETHAESRFAGFDTFSGLPVEWNKYRPAGHFNVDGQIPVVNDTRASFYAGLFQETLPVFLQTFVNDKPLVVHNDSDLYSSTHYTLAMLNDLLVPGSVIIFDEFASPLHEFRAWNDYCEAFMRKARLIGTSGPYAEQAAFQFL